MLAGNFPLVGHMPMFLGGQNHLPLFHELSKKYGKTFRFRAPGTVLYVSNDIEVIQHFMKNRFGDVYEKGPDSQDIFEQFLGRGIFTTNGKEWKAHRAIAAQLFHTRLLRTYVDIFHNNAMGLFKVLDAKPKEIDLQDMFMRYTLDSFGEIGFGVSLNAVDQGEKNLFAIAFDYVQTWTNRRGRWGKLWRLKEKIAPPKVYLHHLDYMNTFCNTIIEKRSTESREQLDGRPDILSKLLLENLNHRDQTGESKYSSADLRDHVMNFLIAGRDTTACMLTWCCYLLSQNRHVEEKLRQEIQDVIGDGEPTYDKVRELRYMKWVLQETLRLYSPVPIDGFTAMKDDVLPGNYFIPKDARMIYVNWSLHRQPDLWEDPEEFKPERWEKPPVSAFAFMAFHGGPRTCLGMELAYLEGKIMLTNLLRRYRFDLSPGHIVTPKAAILLTALHGLHVDLTSV